MNCNAKRGVLPLFVIPTSLVIAFVYNDMVAINWHLAKLASTMLKVPTDILMLVAWLTVAFTVLVRLICSLKFNVNIGVSINRKGSFTIFSTLFVVLVLVSFIIPNASSVIQLLLMLLTWLWLICLYFTTDRDGLGQLVLWLGLGFLAALLISAPALPVIFHPLAKMHLALLVAMYGPLFYTIQEDSGFLVLDVGLGSINGLFVVSSLLFSLVYMVGQQSWSFIALIVVVIGCLHWFFADRFVESLVLFIGLLTVAFVGRDSVHSSLLPFLVLGWIVVSIAILIDTNRFSNVSLSGLVLLFSLHPDFENTVESLDVGGGLMYGKTQSVVPWEFKAQSSYETHKFVVMKPKFPSSDSEVRGLFGAKLSSIKFHYGIAASNIISSGVGKVALIKVDLPVAGTSMMTSTEGYVGSAGKAASVVDSVSEGYSQFVKSCKIQYDWHNNACNLLLALTKHLKLEHSVFEETAYTHLWKFKMLSETPRHQYNNNTFNGIKADVVALTEEFIELWNRQCNVLNYSSAITSFQAGDGDMLATDRALIAFDARLQAGSNFLMQQLKIANSELRQLVPELVGLVADRSDLVLVVRPTTVDCVNRLVEAQTMDWFWTEAIANVEAAMKHYESERSLRVKISPIPSPNTLPVGGTNPLVDYKLPDNTKVS